MYTSLFRYAWTSFKVNIPFPCPKPIPRVPSATSCIASRLGPSQLCRPSWFACRRSQRLLWRFCACRTVAYAISYAPSTPATVYQHILWSRMYFDAVLFALRYVLWGSRIATDWSTSSVGLCGVAAGRRCSHVQSVNCRCSPRLTSTRSSYTSNTRYVRFQSSFYQWLLFLLINDLINGSSEDKILCSQLFVRPQFSPKLMSQN